MSELDKKVRQEFAETMLEIGKEDPRLTVLVGDISHYILQPFAKACPKRYYNIGICEPTIVNIAAGLSKVGFIPVVHTFAPFLLERSFEQIKLNFGYQSLKANLISIGAGFDYGSLGCTHHCYDDFALMKNIEGMNVIYPASCKEFNKLFKQTYANENSNYFRLPEKKHGIDFKDEEIVFGKGIKVREGGDVSIIVAGPQLKTAVDSVEQLEKERISPEIIYIHTIRPFDEKIVKESLHKTKRAIIIEEHSMYGGMLEEVLRCTNGIGPMKFSSINLEDRYVRKYATYEQHCENLGFSVENIIKKINGELI